MKWIFLVLSVPPIALGWHYNYLPLSIIGLVLMAAFLVMT